MTDWKDNNENYVKELKKHLEEGLKGVEIDEVKFGPYIISFKIKVNIHNYLILFFSKEDGYFQVEMNNFDGYYGLLANSRFRLCNYTAEKLAEIQIHNINIWLKQFQTK